MLTRHLYNVLVVLILGIVAFFALRMAANTGTPGQYSSRYDQAGQTTRRISNFPSGKFIKTGTANYGLLFNADGTFSVFDGDNTFVHATYTVEGDVFTETSNTGGCKTDVSFNYTFDGSALTFTYVDNPEDDVACDGRYADFNNITYTLTP